jgi:hypothetical protein
MEAAKKNVRAEREAFVENLVTGGEYDKMFIDKKKRVVKKVRGRTDVICHWTSGYL